MPFVHIGKSWRQSFVVRMFYLEFVTDCSGLTTHFCLKGTVLIQKTITVIFQDTYRKGRELAVSGRVTGNQQHLWVAQFHHLCFSFSGEESYALEDSQHFSFSCLHCNLSLCKAHCRGRCIFYCSEVCEQIDCIWRLYSVTGVSRI